MPESARWLIADQNYERARNELRRAAKINGKLTDDIDAKIEQFNRQVLREEVGSNGEGNKRLGIWRSILAIFTNIHLLKDTMSVFILLFVAEVVYFSLTLNVADLGGSLYINYIISGLSELVSIAFCAVILAYLSRRMCLSLLLLASTVSYLLMALVNIYEESLSMSLILAVNAFGKLTAIGNLMVIILVSQEVFPTVIRQFGTSLCITIGKAGSAVAPFTHELGQMIGQSYCFAMFSLICLSCAVVPCVLSETGNRELPDTVVDVEEGATKRRTRKRFDRRSKPLALVGNSTDYESNSKTATNSKITSGANNNDISDDPKLQNNKSIIGLTLLIDSFDNEKRQQILEDDISNNNYITNSNNNNNNPFSTNYELTRNGSTRIPHNITVASLEQRKQANPSTVEAINNHQDDGSTSDKKKTGR